MSVCYINPHGVPFHLEPVCGKTLERRTFRNLSFKELLVSALYVALLAVLLVFL